jgi:hypothetical protein
MQVDGDFLILHCLIWNVLSSNNCSCCWWPETVHDRAKSELWGRDHGEDQIKFKCQKPTTIHARLAYGSSQRQTCERGFTMMSFVVYRRGVFCL